MCLAFAFLIENVRFVIQKKDDKNQTNLPQIGCIGLILSDIYTS